MTGEEIRARRLRLGLTQAGLANVLGISVRTVEKWEQGTRDPRAHGNMIDMSLCYLEVERARRQPVAELAG